MAQLSFVTPLAYDWKYAFSAIRSYYAIADEIILGIDRDRISWSGKPFVFDDQALAAFIADVDQAGKIRVIEGNYHGAHWPMANDTGERRELGLACRPGNWVVQIDSDEILLNAGVFKTFMDGLGQDCCVRGLWLPVYKIVGNKALVVAGRAEKTSVATRSPQRYKLSRDTDQAQVDSPLHMLHLTWGRTEEELRQKLTNWSHSRDFDSAAAVNLWRSVTLENYQQLRNLHPMDGPNWPYLEVMDWDAAAVGGGDPVSHIAIANTARAVQGKPVTVLGKTGTGAILVSFGTPR